MTGLCNALNDRRALSRQTLRILSDATGEVYITTHPCIAFEMSNGSVLTVILTHHRQYQQGYIC